MTTKTAEQISKELEALRASKEEIESKISSLNYDLRAMEAEKLKNLKNYEDLWYEDEQNIEKIDNAIESLKRTFNDLGITMMYVIRQDNEIYLRSRFNDFYSNVEYLIYRRDNLKEILDWIEYHKTYATFYRDALNGYYGLFELKSNFSRYRSSMKLRVNIEDDQLEDLKIDCELKTLKDGYVSISMSLTLHKSADYCEISVDESIFYSLMPSDTMEIELDTRTVECKIDEVEDKLIDLKCKLIEAYLDHKDRKDLVIE